MTEKEFLLRCNNDINLLDIVKAHGAKFEPEMLDLPRLQVSGLSPLNTGFCQSVCTVTLPGYPYGRALTGPEAKEVVRRCEVVSRLKEYLSHYSTESVHIINILEGKVEV